MSCNLYNFSAFYIQKLKSEAEERPYRQAPQLCDTSSEEENARDFPEELGSIISQTGMKGNNYRKDDFTLPENSERKRHLGFCTDRIPTMLTKAPSALSCACYGMRHDQGLAPSPDTILLDPPLHWESLPAAV